LLSTSADGTIARKKSNILNTKEWYALLHRKAVGLLRSYMTRFDNIKPRKFTGHSVRLQKKLRQTIIRSRELGMTPYTH
jgi:ribosomal protein S18